jgi:MoxR-like ATPase
MTSIEQRNERIRQESEFIRGILDATGVVIVGQESLIERLLMALLTGGHVLIEGVPGLAKTLTIKTLAATINADFQRIQFTPDLLPADLIGTQIYNPRTGAFTPKPGPIFSNIVLADEINRAPAKVQSALLEAMEEKQVTLGDETRPLENPFMVLATQNPIEQEGTYPLPEAQLDRFMLKVIVQYPTRDEERTIIDRMTGEIPPMPQPIVTSEAIERARQIISNHIYVDEKIKDYVLDLVGATRHPSEYGFADLAPLIEIGASPRATINLIKCAKAYAFIRGRGYIKPEDVKTIALDVLRHRIGVSFEAEAEAITADMMINRLLKQVRVP